MATPETDSSGLPDFYTMDQHIGDESRTLEFKNKTLENIYKNEDISTYTSGFLNSEGGTLMIGVDDRGLVKGIELSSNQRDLFGQKVQKAMASMVPPVPVAMYSTEFIRVDPKPQDEKEDEGGDKKAKGHPDKHLSVIRLKICKRQPGTKYQVKTGTKRGYFVRDDRCLVHLSEPDQIEQFVKQIDVEKEEEMRKGQAETDIEFGDILRTVASKKLGFCDGEIQNYIKTNMRFSDVTSEGTLKMLRDWNQTKKKAEERPDLRKALVGAKLGKIAEKYLP